MKQIIFSALLALAIFVGVTQVNAAEIHDAAIRGDLAGVQQQLNNGVAVDLTDDETGCTALMWAANRGYPEIIKLLIERGANVGHANKSGCTALMWAAFRSYTEIVKALLPHLQIEDVLAISEIGDTALDLAWGKTKQLIQDRLKDKEVTRRGYKIKSAAKVA